MLSWVAAEGRGHLRGGGGGCPFAEQAGSRQKHWLLVAAHFSHGGSEISREIEMVSRVLSAACNCTSSSAWSPPPGTALCRRAWRWGASLGGLTQLCPDHGPQWLAQFSGRIAPQFVLNLEELVGPPGGWERAAVPSRTSPSESNSAVVQWPDCRAAPGLSLAFSSLVFRFPR